MKAILFNTPMVQAILGGRKTQTRRVVSFARGKNPDWSGYIAEGDILYGSSNIPVAKSKYRVGDLLWVRETWTEMHEAYFYRADITEAIQTLMDPHGAKWHPSIHMPKEAARLFLRVTGVRVEQVQDILCGDMKAEGCIPPSVTGGQWQQWQREYWRPLWDDINAKRGFGWDINPWVWVYEFERISMEEAAFAKEEQT